MTLSLILLGGVLSVMYSSKLTYNENVRVGRLQENMRAGVEILLHDLRGAGFPGCARAMDPTVDFLSTLSNPTALKWNFSQPVQGFNANGASWTPALVAPLDTAGLLPGSDVIVVRTVRSNARVYRLNTNMATGDADVTVIRNVGEILRTAVPMLISDCEKSTVFAASSVSYPSATTATLTHAISGNAMLDNTRTNISTYKATGAAVTTVAPIDTIIYYIAPSAGVDATGVSRGPALWRISSTEPDPSSGMAPGTPQEVIEGVEALQATYGEDTNGDFLVDNEYKTADAVANWNNVIAISIAVVVRSPEENNPQVNAAQTFDMLGTDFLSPADRRARALFTTTVTLRNRTT